MQIIKIIAIVVAIMVCACLVLFALGFLAFSVAVDAMERQQRWNDNDDRGRKE